MLKGRKAVEQPRVLVYVLFTTILTIAGIYVAYIYMGNIDIDLKFSSYNSRYAAAAARFLNSPNCFSAETSYVTPAPDSKTYWQVSPGVLNWTKFNSSSLISANCINNEKQIWLSLSYIDDAAKIATAWTCKPAEFTVKLTPVGYQFVYTPEDCSDPAKVLVDDTKWQQKDDSYFVLIEDSTGRHPGKLVMRLKE